MFCINGFLFLLAMFSLLFISIMERRCKKVWKDVLDEEKKQIKDEWKRNNRRASHNID